MLGIKTKYIRTKDNQIIVFSGLFQHSDFKNDNPISAGFISFGTKKTGEHNGKEYHEPYCSCYGESVSLGLKADEIKDTELANRQILGNYE